MENGSVEGLPPALRLESQPYCLSGKAGISDASDRNHGEINQWFGRADDLKVTAKAWEFLEGQSN